MEVPNDWRRPALLRQLFDDVRHSLSRIVVVDGHANHLRTGPRQRSHLLHRALHIGRIRIRHRLHHHGRVRTGANAPNIHRYRTSTLYLRHKLSTPKFITASLVTLAIH
jgi:hypothetical protein